MRNLKLQHRIEFIIASSDTVNTPGFLNPKDWLSYKGAKRASRWDCPRALLGKKLGNGRITGKLEMCVCARCHFSRVWLFVTLWILTHQAPPSMGFSGQEYRVGCHALLQGIFPTQDRTCVFCGSCAAGGFFAAEPPATSLEMCKWWFTFQIFQRWIWEMLETLDSPWIRYWISTKVARISELIFYNPWPEGEGHGEH